MKTATTCHETRCDQSVAERPRYFPRQLITPDDLNLEQDYFRARLRWHNRMLHGWGVVCGARVCLVPKSNENGNSFERWKVRIKPGYILGPYGDEINIDCARTFDLRTRGVTGIAGEPCVDVIDPWCSDVVQNIDSDKLYVAVRYKEIAARPVRVQPVGCGCDDSACENSRLVDGYEITALSECPESHQNPPDIDDLTEGPIPDCEPCPDEPWVVLAEVSLDADGNITKIDNCACRRMVVSFGGMWWQCTEEEHAARPETQPVPAPPSSVKLTSIKSRATLAAGVKSAVEMKGENLDRVRSVSFGEGVTVEGFHASDREHLVANVAIDSGAKVGKRRLVLADESGTALLETEGAIEIVVVAAPPLPAPANTPKSGGGKTSKPTKRSGKGSREEV